jgi:hypothetical protein
MSLKPGTQARLIQPELKGVIKDARWDNARGVMERLLEFTEPDGSVTERWFDDELLEAVPTAKERA